MKDQILKIAGVKSEKEFYKKYPSEEAFMKAHGKEFKKAAMGAKMVNTQLHQLTDFGNPPIAQNGMAFNDLLTNAQATNSGLSRAQYDEQLKEAARQKTNTASNAGAGIGNLLNTLAPKDSTANIAKNVGNIVGQLDTGVGKNGKKLKKAQSGFDFTSFGTALGTATQKQGGVGSELANIFGGAGSADKIMGGAGKSFGGSAGAAGLGILNAAPQILQGIGQMKQQKQNILGAEQSMDISDLTAQAAGGRAQKQQNRYVRPEDQLVQPGQLGSPTGVGTNYLAQYGTRIGGNPTQIQNTYDPNNLYTDLGYEPLNESSPKQYEEGGELPKADFGFSDFFQSSGQASIGKGVGSAVGSAFFGPIGGAIGGFLGNAAGNLLGGDADAKKLADYQNKTTQNTQRAAFAAGAKNIQAQNAAFMKEGGWVSNDWQPQTITRFGEYDLKDLLQPPNDADMLRAGGHLKEYTPPSAEAMFTGRPEFEDGGEMAMGGDLQVHRGKAETMSYNPFLPDSGETVMFRGPSHDNGGMPISYGNNGVEVEGGEPAVKLQDGGSPDGSNLVVYGNMHIPEFGAKEIGDESSKGRKFKHYAADIAKNDKKQNQIINRATNLVNNSGDNSPFDQLTLNSGKAMLIGATAKQKANAQKLEAAARVQNAILDTAKEFGYEDSDKFNKDVMKGKLTQAKLGAKLPIAQDGVLAPSEAPTFDISTIVPRYAQNENSAIIPYQPGYLPDVAVKSSKPKKGFWDPITHSWVTDMGYTEEPTKQEYSPVGPVTKSDDKKKGGRNTGGKNTAIADAISSVYDYARPTNQMPLDPNQLMGEMYALSNNQVEPVQAQTYQPMLQGQPSRISLQDQLNSIDGQANAAIRAAGRNPSAQAQIMASAAEMKNKVLGEQFRMNQASADQTYGKNRELLNQAQLQNLGILDKQYERQSIAKSNSKRVAQEALNSISSKIAQNKLENRTLGIEENRYNYRYGPNGKIYNVNAPAQFNTEGSGSTGGGSSKGSYPGYKVVMKPTFIKDDGSKEAIDEDLKESSSKKNGGRVKAINGSIVKALKTL